MFVAAVFGVSDVTFGTTLALAWFGMLGWLGYRYRRKSISRSKLFATSTVALMWLSWSLLQVAKGTSGGVETLAQLVALGLLVAAIAAGVQWWRT